MLFNEDRRHNRDRRIAVRVPISGVVKISFANPAPATIEGEWVEASASGFRVAHQSNALEPGLEIAYSSSQRSGRARVVWTHVLEGRHVSGFVIL